MTGIEMLTREMLILWPRSETRRARVDMLVLFMMMILGGQARPAGSRAADSV